MGELAALERSTDEHAFRSAVRDVVRLTERLLPWLGGAILLGTAVLALAHVHDRNFVEGAAGSHMALARYAREGILFPPFLQDGRYGGTRLMPIPILVHAGLSFLTGELLASGKIAGYLFYACALIAGFLALRRVGVGRGLALALMGAVTAGWVALLASLTVAYDGLSAALQLAAVGLVARRDDRRAAVGAGVLCGLAWFSKISALWALVAIALWLGARRPAATRSFLGAWVVVVAVGAGSLQVLTDGWFARSIIELSSSGVGGDSVVRIVPQMAYALGLSPALDVLLVAAVLETVLAWRERRLHLDHVAFLAAAVLLLVVLTRAGAIANHFLDLAILSAILTGRLSLRIAQRPKVRSALALGLGFTMLLWIVVLGGSIAAIPTARARLASDERFLREYAGPGLRVLAENPAIPVMDGQVPVIVDPFTLALIGARHPELIRPLVARLEAQEFDRVVLKYRPDRAPSGWFADAPRGWYASNLGTDVIRAIQRSYVLIAARDRYYVYAPRDGSS
jgi:hypothetical protein